MAAHNFAGAGALEVRRGERKSGPREGAACRQEPPATDLRPVIEYSGRRWGALRAPRKTCSDEAGRRYNPHR